MPPGYKVFSFDELRTTDYAQSYRYSKKYGQAGPIGANTPPGGFDSVQTNNIYTGFGRCQSCDGEKPTDAKSGKESFGGSLRVTLTGKTSFKDKSSNLVDSESGNSLFRGFSRNAATIPNQAIDSRNLGGFKVHTAAEPVEPSSATSSRRLLMHNKTTSTQTRTA